MSAWPEIAAYQPLRVRERQWKKLMESPDGKNLLIGYITLPALQAGLWMAKLDTPKELPAQSGTALLIDTLMRLARQHQPYPALKLFEDTYRERALSAAAQWMIENGSRS